ncbi:DNA-binding protein [Hafnia alvei]|nr:BRO family protein [Hafnia alvei]MBI0275692.1 DNA-binding protein [Hafnia alvei]MBI0276139.1 DNA-binding protein [Hafnia alvei]PNK93095.1 DNA-binding protein [Hafnia alvei]PNK98324.1 DNA-binding protein [Hafnia alvei]
MNNQLMTFSSQELNFSMHGILYEGKPVFDAVELAKSLGYADPHQALKKHCKSLIRIDSVESTELGFGLRPKGIALAGQADLFRLILRSQLPSAERVQDWVCEEVLPSIMNTGTYSKQQAVVESHQRGSSMNNDIISLARVVAEATASATMKAVIDIVGIQKPQTLTNDQLAPVTTEPLQDSFDLQGTHHTQSEYVPVAELVWSCGLSDAACRRLTTYAGLPTTLTNGDRGHLLIHRESFMAAAQTLLDESTAPSGKLKRWQHPEFGGFTLRLKSSESDTEAK